MKCIYCDSYETRVRNSAKGETGGVYRERVCLSCKRNFYTKESSGDMDTQVIYMKELQKARLG